MLRPVRITSSRRGSRRVAGSAAAGLAALLLLAGCGATGSAAEAAARTSAAKVPAAGVVQAASTRGLQAYGFTYAPAGFVLPQGLDIVYAIDQPNVVTAFFPAADGGHLATWLAANLPAMGYHVQASSADSVVFSGTTWSGAFTSDSDIAALTLRHR
ncbi:MAG: hypothetical protein M0Z51_13270 [Propionibacterium sp.]|nr:hypothetical protein [Propionibacterium sp.]